MGKKQQHQRTKGNLQASSSSRAAQLLQSKNVNITPTLGFAKEDHGVSVDSTLSSSFRKLGKKETVTKQKALKEILDSVSETNIEGCLPLWARNYHKISIENERKVREASQQAHAKIVSLAGRRLAPYLNNIMGPWLEGTCDINTTTAQLSSTALTTAFPTEKLVPAIKFSEKGIAKHFRDRLGSSPSLLSDMKITDPVEAEEKYCRVIGSTLRALISVLTLTSECELINELLTDSVIWTLGRSKQQQVRKHVFTFISSLTSLDPQLSSGSTTTELPDSAHKTLAQHLNACHHESCSAHYSALVAVLNSQHKERFLSIVSLPDIQGQLLDALRSKALKGGVLQSFLLQLSSVVVILFSHLQKEDAHTKCIEDVLASASKCLVQCKNFVDELSLLSFLDAVTTEINQEYSFSLPESSFNTIRGIIATLTRNALNKDYTKQLKSIISNCSSSSQIAALNSVKENEFETHNLKMVAEMLIEMEQTDSCKEVLANKCYDKLHSGHFELVNKILAAFEGLSVELVTKLGGDVPRDIAIINIANSFFIPNFSDAEHTVDQITNLVEIFHHFAVTSPGNFSNIVRTLIQVTSHKLKVFSLFLKLQVQHADVVYLDSEMICEMFDSLTDDNCNQMSMMSHMALLSQQLPSLQEHLIKFMTSSFSDDFSHFNPKLLELLRSMVWNSEQHGVIIKTLLDKQFDSSMITSLTPVLKNLVLQCPETSETILDKLVGMITTDQLAVSTCLSEVFQTKPTNLVMYFNNYLPKLPAPMSLLMQLYDSYKVLNMSNFTEGAGWDEKQNNMFKTCQEFISGCSLSLEEDLATVECIANLVVYEVCSSTEGVENPILQRLMTEESLCYRILNLLIKQNNMMVISVINNLTRQGFTMNWRQVYTLPDLHLRSLVSFNIAFKEHILRELLEARQENDLSIKDKLYLMIYKITNTKPPNEEIFEFLTTSCFDSPEMDHEMTALIFSIFFPILFQSDIEEEDIQFILNCTASTLQSNLDVLSDSPTNQIVYFLNASLTAFTKLYKSLHTLIKVDKDERFRDTLEDWTAFYEPGIQDLALILHDKILSLSLSDTAGYLSPTVLLAPVGSVKSVMRTVLDKNEDITFEECFEYLMSCYSNTLPYSTQTALFYLMLHSQNLFSTDSDSINEEDDTPGASFASPHPLLIETLSEIDLLNIQSEEDYRRSLIKATHVWTLLLIRESEQSSEVLSEHVEFLRSKQLISDFLDNLVYLIKFSSKKYEIVPIKEITSCEVFESHQLASSCFMGIATVFPALLRTWWRKLDKELTISVEKFVTAFVSPTLIKMETDLKTSSDDEALVIKPRPVVREVVATYTMDDLTADLIIYIAPNHPLSPPTVSCERQVGVPVGTWRSWMLQITSMFQNQNSSIVNALEHWRKNMDKQFEGLESCMICFSVVQGPKKALPKPCCRTCKKRFHSACLYKWFSTSGKSTCPMCRTSFQQNTCLRARLQEEPE